MATSSEEAQRSGQSLLAAVSNPRVQALKEYYGKGPTRVKSYMVDEYLFVAMRDPFTVVENTLVRAGKHDLVRDYRQSFQTRWPGPEGAGRGIDRPRGVGLPGQVLFDPDIMVEIFVLDPAGDGSEEIRATAEEQGLMGEAARDVTGSEEPGR